MGRSRGPKCKLCRRQGEKLFLKGDRCNTEKCAFGRRSYAPGQHGAKKMKNKLSEYGIRLTEKQKARRIYGLSERQFAKYFEEADRTRGATGEVLLSFLERRLDNVVFRCLALTRQQARQLVKHGHFKVNGRSVDIPSYRVKPGEVITVFDRSKDFLKKIAEISHREYTPKWLNFNDQELEIKIAALPGREDIESSIAENLIVEYYSL